MELGGAVVVVGIVSAGGTNSASVTANIVGEIYG